MNESGWFRNHDLQEVLNGMKALPLVDLRVEEANYPQYYLDEPVNSRYTITKQSLYEIIPDQNSDKRGMPMNTILSGRDMAEEGIKLQYITPTIPTKRNLLKITMETPIMDGKINLKGNLIFREKPKRAEYSRISHTGQQILLCYQEIYS